MAPRSFRQSQTTPRGPKQPPWLPGRPEPAAVVVVRVVVELMELVVVEMDEVELELDVVELHVVLERARLRAMRTYGRTPICDSPLSSTPEQLSSIARQCAIGNAAKRQQTLVGGCCYLPRPASFEVLHPLSSLQHKALEGSN